MDRESDITKAQWGVKTMTVIAVCFLVAGFFAGSVLKTDVPWAKAAGTMQGPDGSDLTPFYKAWQLLDENFAPASTSTATTTNEQKVFGAISGLTDSMGDPYTVFLPPKQKEAFETQVQGNFGGVGMEVDQKDGYIVVTSPLKDTPAYRAGVKSGDIIIKIDGVSTENMDVSTAVSKIRGPQGTNVTITFVRAGGEPFDVTMTRAQINLPTVDYKLRPDGVFVIQLYTFNALSPDKFREALRSFVDSGSDKLVIDLRGNPGGYLEAAVDLASWFLPVGDVVVTQDYNGKQPKEVYRSYGYNVFTDKLKIAILIDEGSASAAEIFSGALHDHGRAVLVGQKSFGKGSVQQVFDVTENSSIKITIARWLTPKGISISHQGIEPDIKVDDRTREDILSGKDAQLDRAAQYLVNGK